MNSLLLAIDRAGGKASLRGKEGQQIGLTIGDQRLTLTLGPLEPPLATYPPKQLPANEKMKLRLGWYEPPPEIRALWADDEGVVLEDQIEEIAVSLFAYAEWAYRLGIQGQYEYRVRRKRELEECIRKQKADADRKERAQLEKAAAERRAILVSDTAAWRRAADIRAFVEAQVAKWSKEGDADTLVRLQSWAEWAMAQANEMDPLRARAPKFGPLPC